MTCHLSCAGEGVTYTASTLESAVTSSTPFKRHHSTYYAYYCLCPGREHKYTQVYVLCSTTPSSLLTGV
jgi:hypothetical protein